MELAKAGLTSCVSLAVLFLLTKLMGHKQVAQLDFFDYIIGITIGSVAAELATQEEEPWKPLVALLIYGGVSVLLSKVTHKFPRTRKFINGAPTVLMNNGKLYRKNMKKAKLDLSEFMVMCRELGYFNLNQIQTAIFEYNGKLTVLPVSTQRPATPADMGLNPPRRVHLHGGDHGRTNFGGESEADGVKSEVVGKAAEGPRIPKRQRDLSWAV